MILTITTVMVTVVTTSGFEYEGFQTLNGRTTTTLVEVPKFPELTWDSIRKGQVVTTVTVVVSFTVVPGLLVGKRGEESFGSGVKGDCLCRSR